MSIHNANSDVFISEAQTQFEELARQKKIARERLNAMPADMAQKRVSAILHPELWSIKLSSSWGQRYAQDIEY